MTYRIGAGNIVAVSLTTTHEKVPYRKRIFWYIVLYKTKDSKKKNVYSLFDKLFIFSETEEKSKELVTAFLKRESSTVGNSGVMELQITCSLYFKHTRFPCIQNS